MRILFGLFILIFFLGCSNANNQTDRAVDPTPGLITNNQYARGFRIDTFAQAFQLTLFDPWNQGKIFDQYLILPKGSVEKEGLEQKNIIYLPLGKWAVSSTTHIGFMSALGEADRIVGCTSPDRVYNSELSARYLCGELTRIGSDMEFNFESVLGIEPDIILQTVFEGQRNKDRRLADTGVNLLYILEWMEPHPLGRAEWIKVFALLLNKKAEADSIFQLVSNHYCSLKKLAENMDAKPLVMVGNNYNGTWYMPGGQNYMCRYLEDAGFDYPLFETDSRGSLALNFENVLVQFRTADVWLGVSSRSLNNLLEEDPRYAVFDPINKNNVYSVNGRVNSLMGNDFWESGVVYPDRILADMVRIAHPQLLPDHVVSYYKKLPGEH